jgi:hypothetical protein
VGMSTRAAAAPVIATHGVVHIAALAVMPTTNSGGGGMWLVASSAKVEVATVDEVAGREEEIRVDRNDVQVSPFVPALESEQACEMRWEATNVEEFFRRAQIECLQMVGCATRTCWVTVSADTGMSVGSGGIARGSAGCSKG